MTAVRNDRLLELVPYVDRLRDAETGGPLADLLGVIAEQVEVVEAEIDQLYANWFIETCDDWVVPYIADLLGYRSAAPTGEPAAGGTRGWMLHQRAISPRRDVANTIGHRRRKGTLALLERLSVDIAGWPARAVEAYRLLAVAQNVNHLHLDRGQLVDVRKGYVLDRIDGPFEGAAHTAAMGRVNSARTRRLFNVPEVGLFVWRLLPQARTIAPARAVERARNRFTFDILGVDTPLMIAPVDEPEETDIAGELNVPAWIRRRALAEGPADFYGEGRSFAIWVPDPASTDRDSPELIVLDPDRIIAADLSGWIYQPRPGQVAVDPVLGRLAFPQKERVDDGVWVSYRRGFSANMGGGEYARPLSPVAGRAVYRVGRERDDHTTLADAYRHWDADRRADPSRSDALIEIMDDEEYVEAARMSLRPGDHLEIRAAAGRVPLVRLLDIHANRPDSWQIEATDEEAPAPEHGASETGTSEATGGPVAAAGDRSPVQKSAGAPADAMPEGSTTQDGVSHPTGTPEGGTTQDGVSKPAGTPEGRTQDGTSTGGSGLCADGSGGPDEHCDERLDDAARRSRPRLVLDGLIIAGRSLELRGSLGSVVIRHSTLVPGWWLDHRCRPTDGEEASIELDDVCGSLTIDHSIVGSIIVRADAVRTDPLPIAVSDSILDATRTDLDALSGPDGSHAHAVATIVRSTVYGAIRIHAIELGENAIFDGLVRVVRSQVGCIRFSYIRPESRTPRRFACQPDLVEAALAGDPGWAGASAADRAAQVAVEDARVAPRFNSIRYGEPAYAQLAEWCAIEVATGADDDAEMGAFHDLFQPQRLANLRARLTEYTPVATDVDVVFAT